MVDIQFEPEKEALERITKALGGLSYKAPTILKDASNATGRYAMRRIFREIEERYDYDHNAIKIKEVVKRKYATYSNPRTIIHANSIMNKLMNFHVSPRTISITGARPDVYKSHVLKGNGDKETYRKGYKAFIMRITNENGTTHDELVARNSKARYKVKTMYAPSETQMAQNGFEKSEEKIDKKLKANLQKFTQKYLNKLGGKNDT